MVLESLRSDASSSVAPISALLPARWGIQYNQGSFFLGLYPGRSGVGVI